MWLHYNAYSVMMQHLSWLPYFRRHTLSLSLNNCCLIYPVNAVNNDFLLFIAYSHGAVFVMAVDVVLTEVMRHAASVLQRTNKTCVVCC